MINTQWQARPAPYLPIWQAMQEFTEQRTPDTPDEIWLVEHEPVYTLGQAGKPEHILNSGAIPVVNSDRGGQVTYHGPGQVIAYCLVDLRRVGLYVREYVTLLEDVVIDLLGELGLAGADRKPGAPGVYVPVPGAPTGTNPAKIAALGIKVRHGCAYHGIALNVAMDLTPFQGINPCGYEGLQTVDLASCGVAIPLEQAGKLLAERIGRRLEQAAMQSRPPKAKAN